jgi:hypothetical protein
MNHYKGERAIGEWGAGGTIEEDTGQGNEELKAGDLRGGKRSGTSGGQGEKGL